MTWTTLTAETASQLAGWLWTLLLVVWVLLWFRGKRGKKLESPSERLQHIIPVMIGFWLLFGRVGDWGRWLNMPMLPEAPATWIAGLLLTMLGIAIAVYARLSLGSNWSSMVMVKSGHELIRTGLYRRIRHPIYTGLLLAMVGTAMIRNHTRSWLAVAVVLTSFYLKARREERFLHEEFGEAFDLHMRRTGMFLPKWM